MRKILAVLSLVGLVFMACGGGGGASSPEDAVKGMFNAMKSGDIDGIAQYMPEEMRSEITDVSDEDKEMIEGMLAAMAPEGLEIKSSEIDGESAIVVVEFTMMGETQEEEMELMLENGSWVITSGPGMF